MSKFTVKQYDEAIEALKLARQQHIDDTCSEGCSVCGDCHHPDECGFNPLYAMELCSKIAEDSYSLHESLHYLAGYHTWMGEGVGPAKVVTPSHDDKAERLADE